MEKGLLTAFLAVLLIASAGAANYHVTETGAGLKNGGDWNNAFQDFPGINWANVLPGDVIYIAGGVYSGLNIGKSGEPGKPIRIYRATQAEHGSDIGWQASFDSQVVLHDATMTLTKSNLVIDGKVKNGIRIYTPTKGRHGISFPDTYITENIVLRNFQIEGSGYGIDFERKYQRGIDITPLRGGKASNILIELCDIFNQGSQFYMVSAENITVQYCELHHAFDTRSGGACPSPDEPLSTDCGGDHEDLIYAQNMNGLVFRYNTIHHTHGEGVFPSGKMQGIYIYGNVFYSNGKCVHEHPDSVIDHFHIYNNVFADSYSGIQLRGRGQERYVKNNVYFNLTTGASNTEQNYLMPEDEFMSRAQANFRLLEVSGAIDTGLPLEAPYDTDMDGNTRGADGLWDMGAYEHVGACQPSCSGRECGPDGCAGTCGTCEEGYNCQSGQCEAACIPDWECSEWGPCTGGEQARTCTDTACGGSRTETCSCSGADTDCDGCISQAELMAYIRQWKTGNATLTQLMEAISIWKKGC